MNWQIFFLWLCLSVLTSSLNDVRWEMEKKLTLIFDSANANEGKGNRARLFNDCKTFLIVQLANHDLILWVRMLLAKLSIWSGYIISLLLLSTSAVTDWKKWNISSPANIVTMIMTRFEIMHASKTECIAFRFLLFCVHLKVGLPHTSFICSHSERAEFRNGILLLS